MHFTTLLLSAALPLLALAAPVQPRAVSPTQYEISVMDIHFMGPNSGIGNGEWPDSAKFNSTLAFTLNYPDLVNGGKLSTTCDGNWVEHQPPTGWTPCKNNAVSWKFDEFTSEANFVLRVKNQASVTSAYTGNVNIVSNNGGNSGITCLGGPPFSGINCHLAGLTGNPLPPIVVPVSEIKTSTT